MKQYLKNLNRLVLLTLLACLAVGAWGQDETITVGDFKFSLDIDKEEATLLSFKGSVPYVTIPDEVEGCTVTAIGGSAFNKSERLEKITLPKGLKKIEDGISSLHGAFMDCRSLTSIIFPQGLTSIGESAFSGCSRLKSINLPEGLTEIGKYAFDGCSSLKSINLPEGLTKIGEGFFRKCTNLTSINLPQGLTEIGTWAFSGCTGLTSINLPQGLNSIEEGAFSYCSGLTSIDLPERLIYIGGQAFSKCTSLTSINLPEGLTEIGSEAFSGCTSLTSINLPEGLTEIGTGVFSSCTGLTSISLPEGITKIGFYAFHGCSGLKSINLPEGITEIRSEAFSGCTGLKSINLPQGLTEIGNGAFSGCTGLTSINLPEGLTLIDLYAFSGCTGLTSINLPDRLDRIGNKAFSGCTGLTSINLPKELAKIGNDAFSGCTGLTSITIPPRLWFWSDVKQAFRNIPNLTRITFQTGRTNIPENFLADWISIKDVILPEGLTTIGEKAFSGCTKLTSITLPPTCVDIGRWAFNGCTDLGELYVTAPERIDISNLYGLNSTIYVPYKLLNSYQNAEPSLKFRQMEKTSIPMPQIQLDPNEYVGTYYVSNNNMWVMPEGLEGDIIVPESDDNSKVGINRCYKSGSVVPASTPLLLRAKQTEGGYENNFYFETDLLPANALTLCTTAEGNMLLGSRENGNTTAPYSHPLFYRLKTINGRAAFCWETPDGSAFPIKSGEVYLGIERKGSRQYPDTIYLDDLSKVTAITQPEIVNPAEAAKPQAIYTLDGRRVNATSTEGLTKGIYIVNGKKVLVN